MYEPIDEPILADPTRSAGVSEISQSEAREPWCAGRARVERSDPQDGVAVCTVTGDVDSAAVGLVGPAVRRLVDDERLSVIVVDLSRVGFFALSAVAVFLQLAGQAAAVGREFLVVLGNPAVARAFEVTEAEAAIHCYQHGGEALTAASAQAKYQAALDNGPGPDNRAELANGVGLESGVR